MKRKVIENSKAGNFIFGALVGLVLLLTFYLAFTFYQSLYENNTSSTGQVYRKQVELAANELEKEFGNFYEDMQFVLSMLDEGSLGDNDRERRLLERRLRRVLTSHYDLVDSLILHVRQDKYLYFFDAQNNFYVKNVSVLPPASGKTVLVDHQMLPVRLEARVSVRNFIRQQLKSFYISSGYKIFFKNGHFYSAQGGLSDDELEDYVFSDDLQQVIFSNQSSGLRVSQVGILSTPDSQISGTAHSYPFRLYPLVDQMGLVFFQPHQGVVAGIYRGYWATFLGFVVLVVLFSLLIYFWVKNLEKNARLLSENAAEINDLFEKQRLLLQESKGFIYFQNQYFKFTGVGEEVKEIFGYTQTEFMLGFKDYLDDTTVEDYGQVFQQAIKERKESLTYEFFIRHKDGSVRRARTFERILYNEEGAFTGVVGLCSDISSRYAVEEAMKLGEERLRSVLHALPDIIFIYDQDAVFIDYYVQDESLLLSPAEKSLGKSIREVLPSPLNEKVMHTFKKTLKTGKLQTFELESDLPIGKRIFETRFFMLDANHVISMARDITGQKLWEKGLREAMEAAEQASRAKSTFLASMSHEIRTPMNGLLGVLSLFEKTPLTEQQRQYLQIIKESGISLKDIISDVLDYSKIESGRIELHPSNFQIREEIAGIFRMFSRQAEEKQVKMEFKIAGTIPETLHADKEKLRQVLVNLIGNGLKFSKPNGFLRLRITSEPIVGQNIVLLFEVEDSGIGIPNNQIKKLTEPFVQVQNTSVGGTGLGLAISKRLIELMGGDLDIKSTLGKGSIFMFSIFAQAATKEQYTRVEVPLPFEEDDFTNMAEKYPLRLLVVEDNDINLKYMRLLMDQLGYSFATARDGLEAVEKLTENSYDVIFMDIQMPRMDGFQATKKIREENLAPDAFIIGLSANAFTEDIEKAYKAGMHTYLSKPVRPDQIAKLLKERALQLGVSL
ncbi:MAG: response regulator [Nitritalea sp.]